MTTHEFNNHATQAERRREVQRDTYLARAQAELDEAGGRFTKQTPSNIIGENPASAYPRLRQSSPWASPCPSGAEPPLCVDVNSLGFDRSALGADVAPASGSSPLAAVEIETPASIPSNKLRRV